MSGYESSIDRWIKKYGVTINETALDDLLHIASDAHTDGYNDGFEDGFDEANGNEIDPDILDDLETAMQLIDTDRAAARVYLDRIVNGLSLSIKDTQA